jgi:hypothetical protein
LRQTAGQDPAVLFQGQRGAGGRSDPEVIPAGTAASAELAALDPGYKTGLARDHGKRRINHILKAQSYIS